MGAHGAQDGALDVDFMLRRMPLRAVVLPIQPYFVRPRIEMLRADQPPTGARDFPAFAPPHAREVLDNLFLVSVPSLDPTAHGASDLLAAMEIPNSRHD